MAETQVAIIGAGPGGYAAAFLAADLGLQVTLIDQEANPGGVCLYRGCIPSKALLHVAKVLVESREAVQFGVSFGEPTLDLDRMRAWKQGVVEKLTGGLGQLCKSRGVTFVQGRAAFTDSHTLKVDRGEGAEETLTFEHAIVATGSRPATIPGIDRDSPHLLDSAEALHLEGIPKTLLVVGGGYIGLELGSVYAALGSEVSVVEMTSGLLPGADRDLAAVLSRQVKRRFHRVMLDTKVAGMEATNGGIRVRFEGKEAPESELVFDKVLIAVGRRPNSQHLGLESTQVALDERGFIRVDAQRRTQDPVIFAIGDVAGEPMLAHKASHEGRIVAEVIAGQNVAFDAHAIPAVVFTDPELAWCGLTEREAKAQGRSVEIARFPWGASGRAATLAQSEGITKLIVDPESERILGVGIVGPGAGELIAEGVLAVEMAARVRDLELCIHPHPTLSETLMEAAELFYGHSTHLDRPRRKISSRRDGSEAR